MPTYTAVQALQQAFPYDHLALPGTDEYAKLNRSYLSLLQSEIRPAAIFLPRNKEQVARFVQVFKPFALSGATHFAVRGAGQQPLPGCSNAEGGVTVDLRYVTGIEVKEGCVEVGAGERWGSVYEILASEGRGVTGSRSALGGIGGLALAGGLSFFSSREGFICDNVLNYEVVLASGEIVNANAHKHPDLWRALRGGGNNFGIVTRYDFRTFEQGPFWGGSVCYFPPSFPAQVEQLNSMRMLTLKDAAAEQSQQSADGIRCAYMNTTVQADAATLQAASDIYTAALGPLKAIDGITCSLTLQAYPVSLLEKCDNSLGMTVADGPLVSVLLLTWWKNKEDDEKIIQTFKGVLEKIDQDAASRSTAHPFKYMNYAYSFQDPISSYGPRNVEKLREVSVRYDPEGLFQKGVPGGFKLF
ncbi:FAD-binding domain-containing protein [Annulohypoxylon nitens]|nr:FAD-binding domain-containing protein [Annulohypoxylon nitens]